MGRKHRIAAIAGLLILGLIVLVWAKRPTPSITAASVNKKSVKTNKTENKKGNITDNNQVSDSNAVKGKSKKAKGKKSTDRKTKIEDDNQVSDSNWIMELAKGIAPSVLADVNDNKNNISTDSNDVLDANKPADNNLPDANNIKKKEDKPPTEAVLPLPTPKFAELSANLSNTRTGVQSLVFVRNMPIIDALQLLAVRYGKNIIPTSSVTGSLNFNRLNNVNFEEAMSAILGNDYRYQQQGNLVKVYSVKEYQNNEMICRVFTLYYISAAEAKKMIVPVLSPDGKIEVTAAAQTGVPVEETVSAPSGAGDAVAINDMVVVYDYPDRIERAEQIIAAIDVRPKQVLIEATIMTATLTNGMQLGVDWQYLEKTVLSGLVTTQSRPNGYINVSGSSTTMTGTTGIDGGLTVGTTMGGVAAFIKAVESITDVTILANPKILAANKQLGQVYIGTKVAYQSQTTQSSGNDNTTAKVEFLDTGTKLSFRPYIGDDGYIRMDIHPKDSSASLRTISTGVSAPDETSAEIVTNIVVKDGETIVIGGLFRDKISTVKKQVPLLGSIPVVGVAFSDHADEAIREEVIVLLTPHIIDEPSQADGAERAEDVARKKMGAEDELHPTNRMKMASECYERAAVLYVGGRKTEALKELKSAIELYPNYLEAIALEEKIFSEIDPKKKPVRKTIDKAEKPESNKWRRK